MTSCLKHTFDTNETDSQELQLILILSANILVLVLTKTKQRQRFNMKKLTLNNILNTHKRLGNVSLQSELPAGYLSVFEGSIGG
jgi:hypothetical protein